MREVGAFQTLQSKRRYWLFTAVFAAAAVLFTAGLLAWGNPMEFGTRGYWLIAQRRICLLYTSDAADE